MTDEKTPGHAAYEAYRIAFPGEDWGTWALIGDSDADNHPGWEKIAQAVAGPLEAENADLRGKLGNVRDLAKSWTEIEDQWGFPTREALAEAEYGQQILALLGEAGDSVADHPDDCRGTCCEDARREAEADMNATETITEGEA